MANIKSAIKRHKQNLKRRKRNRAVKSRVKTNIKAVKLALQENDIEKAKELLPSAMKEIHKAASKGVFHHNTSARKISRLSTLLHNYESQKITE